MGYKRLGNLNKTRGTPFEAERPYVEALALAPGRAKGDAGRAGKDLPEARQSRPDQGTS
jgi:hypothetical protein